MQQLFETAREEQSVFVQERVCVCVVTYSWYIASVGFQAVGLLLLYMKPIVDTKYLQYYIYVGLWLKLDGLLYVSGFVFCVFGYGMCSGRLILDNVIIHHLLLESYCDKRIRFHNNKSIIINPCNSIKNWKNLWLNFSLHISYVNAL